MLLKVLFIFLLLISSAYSSKAEAIASYAGNGTLSGVVMDVDKIRLPGAAVILQELNTGTVTDSEGRFQFTGLRDGVYTLRIQYVGYRSQLQRIRIEQGYGSADFYLESTHIELDEVIVRESHSGMMQPDQSLSVTGVGREFLAESASNTLMQNLQRLPGINSMDIGTGVSKPVIRGMGFNRLVVAQHNIKQQGQQWGADHGLEIDQYAVERVELIKGPASLIYGSDAIGGAINIKSPAIPQENTSRVEATGFVHSNNDLLGVSAMTVLSRNDKYMRFRTSYRNFADYRVPAEEFKYNNWVIPVPDQRLKNTSGNDLGISLNTGIRKSWGVSSLLVSNFNQQVGFFPASHGIPDPGALQQAGNPRKTDYPLQKVNHFKVVSNTHLLLESDRVELDFGFQQNHRQELNPPHVHGAGPLPEGNIELELFLNTFSGGAKLHKYVSEKQNFVLGVNGNYRENTRGGYNFLLPDYSYYETGLFAVSHTRISGRFMVNAGIRGDFAAIDVTGYSEPVWIDNETISHYRERTPDLQRNFANIAFSTGFSWMPEPDLNLKLNLGSGFRNPGAIELSANGVHHGSFRHEMGDTTLVPERSLQFDLGATWSKKEFYFHLSPFLNYFPNFLFLNPSGVFSELPGAGQVYRFEGAEALHLGAELYVDWHVTHSLHTALSAEWIWAQNLENNYALPFTPPPSLLTEFNYKVDPNVSWLRDLKLLSSVRFTGAQNRVARNEPATDAYVLTHAGFQARIISGGNPVDVMFMVNNLFDVLYQNHLSFYRILDLPEPGRNFTLRITTSLDF